MATRIERMMERLKELQGELEAAFEERRAALRYQVVRRRVVFEAGVRAQHRAARVKLSVFLARTRPLVVLTTPVIYSLIVPIALLDLFVTVFQLICFPIYGMERVKRRDHIVIDRHLLAYLNGIQKLNCVYCGYGNGVISYAREIAGRTEQYWCPIKHARRVNGQHPYYPGFVDYADAVAFHAQLDTLRDQLRHREPPKA
ncbi:MAG: hypothetical protein Q8J98_02530 [Phaeovulum sp.]|uniref:hypothetical protein n=1 Tax=Phaeovulum sp. TaxID=2934796 RepID=UPI0027308959|nr:hypothetical protein [Phaeovulum sp.]MDP2061966.1 hypothetical protein [Phaeovulum sp.]